MAHALSTGSGVVLDLIRSGRATTRTDLIDQLGWSRIPSPDASTNCWSR